ncbi:hypothetical protein SNL152K_6088 [Streptomyces sp. NL15-2K]|nr:hypothetical protein SNL152K_6088 [Streptomyces sp. NL15-2K]
MITPGMVRSTKWKVWRMTTSGMEGGFRMATRRLTVRCLPLFRRGVDCENGQFLILLEWNSNAC